MAPPALRWKFYISTTIDSSTDFTNFVIVGFNLCCEEKAMSNAGLDESTEEMHEINVAEIKKLKVGFY